MPKGRKHLGRIWFSLFIVLTTLVLSASAQSGRVAPTPQPTPTPQAPSPKESDAKSTFVVDPQVDKYKLIFPTSYEINFALTGKKARVDGDETRHSRYHNFIEQLNQAGAQGYRLLSVVDNYYFSMALLKLDKVQYEYVWFETTSHDRAAKIGFVAAYTQLAKQGYRLAYHSLIYGGCTSRDPENILMGEDCEFKDLFLVEREKGDEKPIKHRLVYSVPRGAWERGKPPHDVVLTTAVKEKLDAGFYPTGLLSKFEILLEQLTETDERLADKSDVQVVRASSFWERDNLPKKVNEMAQQGYRLALVNNEIALMYRHRDAAVVTPLSYIWLSVGRGDTLESKNKKEFDKKLATLQESGAIYRMTYPNYQGIENRLIFEQSGAADGRRREYRVLRLERQAVDNVAEKRVYVDLTPASKEALKEFNRLVKEGFEVRDLFMTDEPCVLLERTQ